MRTGTSERPELPLAVTIGAGGMGMSIARRLGNHYRVLLADLDGARAEDRAAAMRADGYDARGIACDIMDGGSVARLAETVAASGPLRAVAHVAAISPSMGSWREILALNLVAAARVERALLPLAGTGAAAVFVSSMAAHLFPTPDPRVLAVLDEPLAAGFIDALEDRVPERTSGAAYALAKLGVNRMCARHASAWGRRGARIVSMSPGMIATPMGALEFSGPTRQSKVELLERSPIRREGTMVETADAVEFLVSDRASFITGIDLLVDGGVTAAMLHTQQD